MANLRTSIFVPLVVLLLAGVHVIRKILRGPHGT